MHEHTTEFDDWQNAYQGWSDVSVSELHGLMTALVAILAPPTTTEWRRILTELCFSLPNDEALALLTQYGEDVGYALSDGEEAWEFAPLVPDDEWDLDLRLLALKDWAGGFISGVGVADISLNSDEQAALIDLAKIASLRLDDDEQSELNFDDGTTIHQNDKEADYAELYEFARLVPAVFAVRPKKQVKTLALIRGLSMDRKTANELLDS